MILILITERDAFDTLFDHAPDKLQVVKKVNGLDTVLDPKLFDLKDNDCRSINAILVLDHVC